MRLYFVLNGFMLFWNDVALKWFFLDSLGFIASIGKLVYRMADIESIGYFPRIEEKYIRIVKKYHIFYLKGVHTGDSLYGGMILVPY